MALEYPLRVEFPHFKWKAFATASSASYTRLEHPISHFLTSFHCKRGTTFGSHAFPFVSFNLYAYDYFR